MKKYKNFEDYLKDWRAQNKERVKVYNIKSFVRQFIEIKKSGKVEELGLQDIERELKELFLEEEKIYNQQYNQKYNLEDWISYEEASKILNIKPKNLWKPIKKGYLEKKSKKELGLPGKGNMLSRASVERYKEQQKKRGD